MAAVRVIYVLLMVAFLIMLIAFAIAAFYESPDYERSSSWQFHQEDQQAHDRNVFFIAYAYGIVLAVLGAKLRPRLDIIRHGLLLGSMGAIIYAIAQPDLTNEFRFAGIAVGLAVLLYAGYTTLLEKTSSQRRET